MPSVSHVTVRGFRSIADLERFELGSLNVLIGPNGAGKSNLLDLFRLLRAMATGRLQLFVAEEDGPEALLFRGRQHTTEIDVECAFGETAYNALLKVVGERLVFARESTRRSTVTSQFGSGHEESKLIETASASAEARYVRDAMSKWGVYHFHDTSTQSAVRNAQRVRDNIVLHSDGSNLAPFLRLMRERHPENYRQIVDTVRRAAPFIDDFLYRDEPGERVELEWLERDVGAGRIRSPRQLSDGTIRFICLATLLLQPVHLQPATILIDEPELGLHPATLSILAAYLDRASEARQVIVSTQSVDLLSEMKPDHVVVVERCNGSSVFRRPDWEQLSEWLEDHSLGELWLMNTLGGRP